jgi:hypothetical protein
LRSSTPTATATCAGVTLPKQSRKATCAVSGESLTLNGVQVIVNGIQEPTNFTGMFQALCANAAVVNMSDVSVSIRGSWSLGSVSTAGTFHVIPRTPYDEDGRQSLGEGPLAPDGKASGTVCFVGLPSQFTGPVLLAWSPPGKVITSAVWVAFPRS